MKLFYYFILKFINQMTIEIKTSNHLINNLGVKCSSYNLNYASNSPCMYNPKCGCYKRCHHVNAGGRCAHWGAGCRPR